MTGEEISEEVVTDAEVDLVEEAEVNQNATNIASPMEHARTRDLSADRRRPDIKTQLPLTTNKGDRQRIVPTEI